MPAASVIIPTYNRAHVLGRAIGSVLAQSYRDFELIVVDDGSTDDTAALPACRDERVTLVRQDNRGVSAARNTGIRHSRGRLTAFLDSDDEWLPDKLARQVGRPESEQPDFICHTDEIWLRDGKTVPQKRIHRKQGGRFFERSLQRCLISPSSVMLSRSLLDRIGWFDEDLPAAEDYDLWLRITAFHEVDFVAEPLVVKHGGGDDQLSRVIPAIDRYRIQAIRKILRNPALPEPCRENAVREVIRRARIVAAGCMKRGKEQEAEVYLELARSYEASRRGAP
ncbi:MAG: glycosyltransferase [Pseudomonadota bacterium]